MRHIKGAARGDPETCWVALVGIAHSVKTKAELAADFPESPAKIGLHDATARISTANEAP